MFYSIRSKNCVWQFQIKCIFFVSVSKNTISIQKLKFWTEYVRYNKNVEMENYLSDWGLQSFIGTFFDKIWTLKSIINIIVWNLYILCFNLKKPYWKSKIQFFNQNMSEAYKTECETRGPKKAERETRQLYRAP